MVTLQAICISTSLYVGDTAVPVCVKMTTMRKMNRMRTYYLRTSLLIQLHVVVNFCCLYTIAKQLDLFSIKTTL